MGVINGQAVSAEVTNPAFINKNVDDTMSNKLTFSRSGSGATISDIQAAVNKLYTATGASEVATGTVYSAPASTILDGDSHQTALTKLANKFANVTGHTHDGTAGNGGPVPASAIANFPLLGYFNQGTDLSLVSGSSFNVTTQLSGKSASSNSTTTGVVVNTPYNKVILRQSGGINTDDEFVDSLGNVVYGRITFSVSTFTLSFYVELSGTETAYSFPSPVGVRWYYQELYNPTQNPPVYSTLAFIPSDNATADVVEATTSVEGKVLLSSSAPAPIASSGSAGTGNAIVANANHTHEGVHSLGIFGNVTQLLGDVQLEAGNNISMAFDAGKIQITATGTGSGSLINAFQEVPTGTVDGSNANFVLSQTPQTSSSLIVFIDSVVIPNSQWSLAGNTITFGVGSIPQTGQSVYAFYTGDTVISVQEVPTGTVNGTNPTFSVSSPPISSDNLLVFVDGLETPVTTGWILSGTIITFQSGWIPQSGQSLYVFYLTVGTPPVTFPGGTVENTVYHTVSSGEASAKQFTLPTTPASPSKALVDVISSCAQIYGVDFTISGAVFNWSGLGLDGVLTAGDVVRVYYFS